MNHFARLCGRLAFLAVAFLAVGCSKQDFSPDTEAQLVLSATNDSSFLRLGANGQPEAVAPGLGVAHMTTLVLRAQKVELLERPDGGRTAVLFELTPSSFGGGTVLPENGSLAVFDRFFHLTSLKQIAPGDYSWLRITPLTVSNFETRLLFDSISPGGTRLPLLATGSLTSIYSNNTLIDKIENLQTIVGTNRLQQRGDALFVGSAFLPPQTRAPVNILNGLRLPEPALIGSAGAPNSGDLYLKIENGPLRIGSRNTKSIYLDLTLGVNHSLEWTETNGNQLFEPALGEQLLRMGTRGGKVLISTQ